MQILNSANRYGIVAIWLHWIMAILLIVLLLMGLYMVRIPFSLLQLKLFGWHKELGFLVLILVVFRLAWRLINNGRPYLPDYLPYYQQIGSIMVHWSFYFFMFALPISGWLISSASALPASFFGLFIWPDLIAPNEEQRLLFSIIHQWLAYVLIITLGLHAGAALKHHFVDKNDILRRIL